MDLDKQQAINLIGQSHHILVTTRHQADFDEIATSLAWLQWLKNLGKQADLVIDNDNRQKFDWLPESHHVKLCEQAVKKYTIKIKTDNFKLGELSYDLKDGFVEIYLSPKEGKISSHDVEHHEQNFPYDLVICLGSSDFESLGRVYRDFRQEIFKLPIININRRSDNTNFGQINIVDLTATSLAEICFEFFKADLNPTLAHYLLTGMISATNSFQTVQVTPRTLSIASELIVAGASRGEIILCLYRNKDIDTLKTWGIILSRLEQTNEIVYSFVSRADMLTKDVDWKSLANDLMLSNQTAAIAVLFYEKEFEEIHVKICAKDNYDLLNLLQRYDPQGSKRQVEFIIKKSRPEASREVIDTLVEKLKLINS